MHDVSELLHSYAKVLRASMESDLSPSELHAVVENASAKIDALAATMSHGQILNEMAARVREANKQWWVSLDTGEPLQRNVGELLMLMVSELAEALEGHRKGLADDKLPERSMFEVELADCIIRILDTAGAMGLDIGGAFEEKMRYNAQRADHKPENRRLDGGKKY